MRGYSHFGAFYGDNFIFLALSHHACYTFSNCIFYFQPGLDMSSPSRFLHAILPAFILAVSVGQIYAFTIFSDPIATRLGETRAAVQFAFSLGIFFLGMGAAFFGKIVEKNIRASTFIGTALFTSGLVVTALGIRLGSLALVYLGYGVLGGTGTGIIYISPVKTMMLHFPDSKAIAAAVPIISFGLGSSLATILTKGFSFTSRIFTLHFAGLEIFPVDKIFIALAVIYAIFMVPAAILIKKPSAVQLTFAHDMPSTAFSYRSLAAGRYFIGIWLFMFLNISCGLGLIPLAKQLMGTIPAYGTSLVVLVLTLMGLMNGSGRFIFAWWSDRLQRRANILLIILAISAASMALALAFPVTLAFTLIAISACYGAGFSVLPAVLADHYGMRDISKIHGAALSAWGVAGLVGNQVALPVFTRWGVQGVCALLLAGYTLNAINVLTLRRR